MSRYLEIIPAILPKDFFELEDKIERVKGVSKMVQLDVCDGQFVPNATWPYRKQDDSFEKIVSEEQGMPGWQELDYEIDLMVNKPHEIVENWIQAGAKRLILHLESKPSPESVVKAIEIIGLRAEIGIAINIETPIEALEPFKDTISCVQCMGIDHIGFQQQPFDPKDIQKVRDVKQKYPNLIVSVDGGVTLETAPALIAAGVDRLVVGHALFENDSLSEAIAKFHRLV